MKTEKVLLVAAIAVILFAVLPNQCKGQSDCDRYAFLCDVNTHVKPLPPPHVDANGNRTWYVQHPPRKLSKEVIGRGTSTIRDAREPLKLPKLEENDYPFKDGVPIKVNLYASYLPAVKTISVSKAQLPMISVPKVRESGWLEICLSILLVIFVVSVATAIVNRRRSHVATQRRLKPFIRDHERRKFRKPFGAGSEPALTGSEDCSRLSRQRNQQSSLSFSELQQSFSRDRAGYSRSVIASRTRFEDGAPLSEWARKLQTSGEDGGDAGSS